MPVLAAALVGMAGLAAGSFVNALVWRHFWQPGPARGKSAASKRRPAVWQGRSRCPKCAHALKWLDLLPLIGWLLLKGRCRYCARSISWQYPAVELGGAVLFILSYVVWPYGWQPAGWLAFLAWVAVLGVFLALTVTDIRWQILPNRLVAAASGFSIVVLLALAAASAQPVFRLAGGLMAAGLLFGLFYVLFQLSGGRWLGGGDVKLVFSLGLLAGSPMMAWLVLFAASLMGSLVGVPLMLRRGRSLKYRLAFGPFLMAATIGTFLLGPYLKDWLARLFAIY